MLSQKRIEGKRVKKELHFSDLKQKEIQRFQATSFVFEFTEMILLHEGNHLSADSYFIPSDTLFQFFILPESFSSFGSYSIFKQ